MIVVMNDWVQLFDTDPVRFWVSVALALVGLAAVLGAIFNWPRWYADPLRKLFGFEYEGHTESRTITDAVSDSPAQGTFDSKLREISALNDRISMLSREAQAELDLQIATARQITKDAEQSKALASLNADQQHAAERLVAAQINEAFARNSRGERSFQIWLSACGFIAGVLATIVTTLLFSAIGIG